MKGTRLHWIRLLIMLPVSEDQSSKIWIHTWAKQYTEFGMCRDRGCMLMTPSVKHCPLIDIVNLALRVMGP